MGFDDLTNSAGFQYGYPLLTALLAASGNRGAGVSQALNAGLGISNYYSQQQRQNSQNDLLRQKLGDVFKATAPM